MDNCHFDKYKYSLLLYSALCIGQKYFNGVLLLYTSYIFYRLMVLLITVNVNSISENFMYNMLVISISCICAWVWENRCYLYKNRQKYILLMDIVALLIAFLFIQAKLGRWQVGFSGNQFWSL